MVSRLINVVSPIQLFSTVKKARLDEYYGDDFVKLQIDMGGGVYNPPDISNWPSLYGFGNQAYLSIFSRSTFSNLDNRIERFSLDEFMINGGKLHKNKFLLI